MLEWHDLEKDPNDLPKNRSRIIYCFQVYRKESPIGGLSYNVAEYFRNSDGTDSLTDWFSNDRERYHYRAWAYFNKFEG